VPPGSRERGRELLLPWRKDSRRQNGLLAQRGDPPPWKGTLVGAPCGGNFRPWKTAAVGGEPRPADVKRGLRAPKGRILPRSGGALSVRVVQAFALLFFAFPSPRAPRSPIPFAH